MANIGLALLWILTCSTLYGIICVICYCFLAGVDYLLALRRRLLGIETTIRINELLVRMGHKPLRRSRRKGRHHRQPIRGRHALVDTGRPGRSADRLTRRIVPANY